MIIKLKLNIKDSEFKELKKKIKDLGLEAIDASSTNTKVIGLLGDTSRVDENLFTAIPCVDSVTRISAKYKKASREFKPSNTIIKVGPYTIGGNTFTVMAGPCSVESKKQMMEISKEVSASGAQMLRGGAYKPRTSPYSFQGLGHEGIMIMKEASKATNSPIVTEIQSVDDIEDFVENVDVIQVGARNMQNFHLLKALGKIDKPILLKRGMSATIEEWLMSAEYILAGGNDKVILCERGIRTFETYTRNTLDLSAVLAVKKLSHLPVIVDPSHACGKWDMIEDLSKAALAVGADGIIVEVHNHPEKALSDGAQSLKPNKFEHMMKKLKAMAPICDKVIE